MARTGACHRAGPSPHLVGLGLLSTLTPSRPPWAKMMNQERRGQRRQDWLVTGDDVPPFIQQMLTACLPGAGAGPRQWTRGPRCVGGKEDGDKKRVKAKQRLKGRADGRGMSLLAGGQSCSQKRAGRRPCFGLLSTPPQLAPHSPAAAWLWGGPLWAPSGGQRSSPLSTAPISLGSTTIEGSRWPSRGPFSRMPTAACGEGGWGLGGARP